MYLAKVYINFWLQLYVTMVMWAILITYPRWGFTDLLPCTPVSRLGSAPIYRPHGRYTHSLHQFLGASSTVGDWSDPYSSHNRGYICNLYVSLYWITLIYIGIPVPNLVGIRGTWPTSGEVPARDRNVGAVNVEGGSQHSPRKGKRRPGTLDQPQRQVPHLPYSA